MATTLNPRRKAVVDFYYGVSNFNKTDALRRAGYKHPDKAHHLFKHPSILAEVARREDRVRQKYDVSYDRVIGELARIAYSSVLDYGEVQDDGSIIWHFDKATADELKAIGEITVESYTEGQGDYAREVKRVKVKPWNKLEALEKLMRHAGLSREKSPLEGAVSLVDRLIAARNRVAPPAAPVIDVTEETDDDAGA